MRRISFKEIFLELLPTDVLPLTGCVNRREEFLQHPVMTGGKQFLLIPQFGSRIWVLLVVLLPNRYKLLASDPSLGLSFFLCKKTGVLVTLQTTRMAGVKKSENNKCWWGCGAVESQIHRSWVQIGGFGSCLGAPRTMTTQGITAWCSGFLPRYRPKRTENLRPHNSSMNVHSSLIQNRQRAETTQAHQRINGQTKCGNPPNGILLGNREGYPDSFSNLNLENMRLTKKASHKGPRGRMTASIRQCPEYANLKLLQNVD